MGRKPDFSGWATKFNIKCADGRTIKPGAFNECDGKKVPMVWQHDHNSPDNVLGHCILECRKEGVYAYGYCNDTERGQKAKILVHSGDIDQFSIYANQLEQNRGDVVHGTIREVSLVLSGANTGAIIDNPMLAHSGEIVETEALIYIGEPTLTEEETMEHSSFDDPFDVMDSLDEAQHAAVAELIGQAIQHTSDLYEEEKNTMRTNIFEKKEDTGMKHSTINFEEVVADAKKLGSMREAYLAHAATEDMPNGQPGIDYGIGDGVTQDKHLVEGELLPHPHQLYQTPGFWDARRTEWCATLLAGVRRSPFSRLKNMWFDITNADYSDPDKLRAKGYLKGHKKVEEVFGMMKRTTQPTTVYKKQRIDRDDLLDITGFDIVRVMKSEMRIKLDEELALAMLLGDGRNPVTQAADKIDETCIRPIWTEDELFCEHYDITGVDDASSDADVASAMLDEVVRQRRNYRGKGRPTLFISSKIHTEMLLLKDLNGRRMFDTDSALCTYMNVAKIVDVDDIDGTKVRTDASSENHTLVAILINPSDYVVGADKGGNVNMFDDFDIDYNQYIYLIETRISGSLLDPKVAQVFELAEHE